VSTKSISPAHALSQFADDPAIIATAVAQEVTTVTTEAELPESLKYLKGFLPGLLFAHHSPDGEIVPQFRPDNPKDGPKYIFPRNSGSVLSINPLMTTDRPTVAIIEGTKQMIFATTYAPDDVLVVGIQGCWGWSSNGQGLAALDDVVQGKDVIVIFDADVSSNPDVYNAGESLTETLSVIGAKSVKFAPIPGSRSVGLDDFLANRAVANRGSAFSEILAKAVPFNKVKKPAKRKVSVDSKDATFSYVSVLLGEICTVEFEKIDDDGSVPREQEARPIAGVVDERNVRRVDTLLHAAVTVESVIVNDNDLTPGVEASYSFDLKVQFGPEDDCREQVIYDVPDNDLGNVRRWLARAGIEGLQTELGSNGLGLMGGLRIAEAIRADMKTREFKQRVSRPNSGWYEYDGEPMWSDVDGSHTTSRKRTDVVAKLEGSLASLSIPGFNENFDMKILFDALDKFFDVENYLVDSTPWIASVSALFWALAGGDPDAVLYILGGEGSGKSSIMGLVSSFLSPQWGTAMNPMASADGSSAYLRDLVKQPHNMLLVVDDVRGRSSSRAQDTQADGLEALIRPAYGGGGAFAPKQVRNANGDWVQEKPKYNRFFLCIVGEVLPEAERQSSIERCLVIEVDKATSLRPAGDTPSGISGHEHFTELSRDHALVPISSAFLVAACQWIAYEGGLEKWKASLSSERTRITSEAVATRVADTSPRVRNVAGTFLAGASTFLEWVQGTGYFTEEQLIATETKWHDQLITATQRHSVVNLYSGGEADVVISKVVDAVASGRFAIGPAVANQTTVGVPTTVKIDGESVECIALLPGIVGQIAGPNNLPGRLDKLLVRDSAGRRTRSVRIDGTMTARCFVIKRSDWNDPE
jgi:hypothetical protein